MIPIQQIHEDFLKEKGIQLYIQREDLLHPEISGNKWRKLKYNIEYFSENQFDAILTFGGAYSNHIAATAAAGKKYNLKTIGVIRGDKLSEDNPTLSLAKKNGMHLHFVSRKQYRQKDYPHFIQYLTALYGNIYIVPEGGGNELGIKGCAEILDERSKKMDVICCACGTGSTAAGLIQSKQTEQHFLGFSALKDGYFLENEIAKVVSLQSNWKIIHDYHFGGYAKVTEELVNFYHRFKQKHNITLDMVYTAKMLYGIFDLISRDYFTKESSILAIHTGGLQGNKGFFESRD